MLSVQKASPVGRVLHSEGSGPRSMVVTPARDIKFGPGYWRGGRKAMWTTCGRHVDGHVASDSRGGGDRVGGEMRDG